MCSRAPWPRVAVLGASLKAEASESGAFGYSTFSERDTDKSALSIFEIPTC